MVWSVDTTKLQQVPGSKNEKLRRMIGGRFKRDFESLDELFDHQIAAGGPNTYEALRQIVDGTIPEGVQNGAIYRYAFKLIVDHLGTFLDNNAVCPIGSDFGDIDRALADLAIPFKLSNFYGSDLPVKLPHPDDFPLSGWVDEATVVAVHDAFLAAKPPVLALEVRDVFECIRGWFRDAAAKRRGLVGFYH